MLFFLIFFILFFFNVCIPDHIRNVGTMQVTTHRKLSSSTGDGNAVGYRASTTATGHQDSILMPGSGGGCSIAYCVEDSWGLGLLFPTVYVSARRRRCRVLCTKRSSHENYPNISWHICQLA